MSNPFGRSAREQAEYERWLWAGSTVYRNKLGIRDALEPERAERMLSASRAAQGFPETATPRSYSGLRAMHRHRFQDLYDWAGVERSYTTGRGHAPFARAEFIQSWVEKQFAEPKKRKFLCDVDIATFASGAAEIVNEINAAHPFIGGNGRAQRHWLRALAAQAGFSLRLLSSDRERWNEASKAGFERSDHNLMAALLVERLTAVSG